MNWLEGLYVRTIQERGPQHEQEIRLELGSKPIVSALPTDAIQKRSGFLLDDMAEDVISKAHVFFRQLQLAPQFRIWNVDPARFQLPTIRGKRGTS